MDAQIRDQNNRRLIDTKSETMESFETALETIPRIQTGLGNVVEQLKSIFQQSDNYLQHFSPNANGLKDSARDIANKDINDLAQLKQETLAKIEYAATNLQNIHNKTLLIASKMSQNEKENENNVNGNDDELQVAIQDSDDKISSNNNKEYQDMKYVISGLQHEDLLQVREKLIELDRHCKMLLNEMNEILTQIQEYVTTVLMSNAKIYTSLLAPSIISSSNATSADNQTKQVAAAKKAINDKDFVITDEYLKSIDVDNIFKDGWNKARKESMSKKNIYVKEEKETITTSAATQSENENKNENKDGKRQEEEKEASKTTNIEPVISTTTGIEETIAGTVEDDSSDAKQDGIFNHPLFYVWSFAIISFITVLSIFASFLVYKSK